jgi:hypothetical protein
MILANGCWLKTENLLFKNYSIYLLALVFLFLLTDTMDIIDI